MSRSRARKRSIASRRAFGSTDFVSLHYLTNLLIIHLIVLSGIAFNIELPNNPCSNTAPINDSSFGAGRFPPSEKGMPYQRHMVGRGLALY